MAGTSGTASLSVVIDFEDDQGRTILPDDATSTNTGGGENTDTVTVFFCEVCYLDKPSMEFIQFSQCGHRFCASCVTKVFETSIMASTVDLQCLSCEEPVSQSEIQQVVDSEHFEKYLGFSVRKYLSTKRSVCYCRAVDCPFACINSEIPSSLDPERTHFVCQREGCGTENCNLCFRAWHPGRSCDEFAAEQAAKGRSVNESVGISDELKASMGTKNCPSCNAIIQKTIDDGSCNQVVCAVCKTSFCWLCGRPVTEMHYMSPTGCPLYGDRMWTRRRKWCCRFGLWLTAPLLTLLLSLVVIPVILIVLPLGVGYKVYKSSQNCPRLFRVAVTVMAVGVCVVLAPLVAFLASILTIPLSLLYFYCFIPVHVCAQSNTDSPPPPTT